jgi:3-oxoacyl-[acyl-carrier protein] reductase
MSGTGRAPVMLVTGGARGLGAGIARAAGHHGFRVAVTARDRAAADAVAATIRDGGGEAVGVRCDVTEPAEVEAAVRSTVEHFGGLDALVLNATSVRSNEALGIDEADLAAWNDHVAVGIRPLLHFGQAAHTHLARRGGSVCVLSSPSGIQGSARMPLYSTVKAAQRGFVKSLALEWGPQGVRVNAVAPLALTDSVQELFTQAPERRAQLEGAIALGRVGDPELDIAPAVLFLCSDAARYVTGQTLVVSGGRFTSL